MSQIPMSASPERSPTRRDLVALAAASLAAPALAGPAWAAAPGDGRLVFAVFRNGGRIGAHTMTFSRASGLLRVETRMSAVVRLGPIPVFRYEHSAEEVWRDGRFERLQSATSTNGRREHVLAQRADGAVVIETGAGRVRAPAEAAPLTHWNPAVFQGPLFNPQTGKLLKLSARRSMAALPAPASGQGARWSLRGEADIDDWYDVGGVWAALRGKLTDGSTMEYRRA